MRTNFMHKVLPLLLMAGLLVSCGRKAPNTTDAPGVQENDPLNITLNRTPTPVLDPNDIPINIPTSRPDHGGSPQNPPASTPEEPQLRGDGEALEGYTQLLYYIDRSTLQGPTGWDTHPLGDLFDGLFESTDQGSNKYGHGGDSADITWKMTKSVTVSAYTIYTANDASNYPARNPKDWTFYGSADGENWVELHTVRDAGLPKENYTPTTYTIENSEAYRYYRFAIEAVEEGGLQLSELLLYTTDDIPETPPPATPDNGVGTFDGVLPVFGLAEEGRDVEPLLGDDAAAWVQAHTSLHDQVLIDTAYISAPCWADSEGPDRLFDGSYTEEHFAENGGGKLGGTITDAYIVWQTQEAVAPTGYVLITGNDTATYDGRNPESWVLFGSTDGENWVALDAVKNANMIADNFLPHVYTMENTERYNWFCLSVEKTGGGLQLSELILFQ